MKIAAFLTATLIGLSAVAQPKIVAHAALAHRRIGAELYRILA